VRAQANIDPRSHDVAGLRVFVSYKTEDLQLARRVRAGLEERGFEVTLFEPVDRIEERDEADLRAALRRSLLEADFLCLVNSPEAVGSDWIAYELVQAARILGRVCLLDTTGAGGQEAADRLLEAGRRHAGKEGLHVQHTTIDCTLFGPRELDVLVHEMLTSPDERWYDGTVPVPAGPLDLKARSRLRKAARARVLEDPRFADQVVEEVIPYLPSSDRSAGRPGGTVPSLSAGPSEEAFLDLAYREGRLPILDRLRSDAVDVLHATYRSTEPPSGAGTGAGTPGTETGAGTETTGSDAGATGTEAAAEIGAFVVVQRGVIGRKKIEIRPGTFTDPRDGERYRTVIINGRTWLADNLRFAADDSWAYGDDPGTVATDGRLYTWDGAMAACPDGWHVASMREWLILAETFGGYRSNLDDAPESVARAERSFRALTPGGASGFDVHLAGFRDYFGAFRYWGVDAYFWSSTERDDDAAHILFFLGGAEETQHGWAYKIAGHSVRCVRGESVDWRRWR
jgi:uncharacterized protein (TIGR02145 family)